MKNYKFYGTKDGRVPMKMPDPADFGDDQKESMAMYMAVDGAPVILSRSNVLTPMPWCLFSSICSTVFFRTYKEAQDYCKQRGYKLVRKGGKGE